MLTFIELLIGVVVIVGVARYIIKGYSATGVLFVGGLLLLIISAIMGHKVLPSSQASTGYSATDIVEYVKILLMSRGGDLGMMIMMLCGFAAYMTHIGANDMVVKLASKPLQYINSPYLLMIAAGVFAQGLSTIGFIQSLISIATSFGSASIILMLVLVILTMLAAVTTGSGNAPFYAFVEMIPKLAHSSGINPAYLTIPMLQASNLGRTLSPVSGVVVAVAGMAKISPFEVVKRTSVPVLVGLVIVIVATELMVPGTAAAVTGK
ncbi:C4-dicarboxylate transporter DcuC [Escherichia coli]|nr:C4-dicarboxylate transporter DcuC [Escherichia coli]MCI3421930.1 C4-dicarboxylate transporter DcuC [Escherichia coli]